MTYEFVAIFSDDDGQIAFYFYDEPNWYSCGENILEAILSAQDILGGNLARLEREGGQIPKATPIAEVEMKLFELAKVIRVDTEQYVRELEEQLRQEEVLAQENPVKYIREQTGLSIREFAEQLGAPYRTVQDWNSGASRPPKWSIPLLVDKFLRR